MESLRNAFRSLSTYFEGLDQAQNRNSRIFLWLWSASFYLNYAESWDSPLITFSILLVCVATFFIKNVNYAWGLYLAVSLSVLIHKFPILANHSIFTLFVNLFLAYRLLTKRFVFDESLVTPLRLGLAVVYFWAGIHKINTDFMFLDKSCAFNFMDRASQAYFQGHLSTFFTRNPLLPYFVVLLEVAVAVLISLRKTFFIGLLCATLFHAQLAALEFIDFSMNSMSILVLSLLVFPSDKKADIKKIARAIPFFMCAELVAGLYSYFDDEKGSGSVGYILQTLFFLSFSVFILYFGIRATRRPKRSSSKFSYGLFAFPALLLFFGSFNYLGLSTAGTFSMFSNLKTEGDQWNHLFLPKFLKVFDYQDRIFWVRDLDRKFVRTNKEHPRVAHGMPEIEFYRALYKWREWDKFPKRFDFIVDDKHYVNPKLAEDPEFQGSPFSWWEHKLFYFRRIQAPGSPNICRW